MDQSLADLSGREYKEFFLLYRSSDYHAPAVMGCSGRPIGNCDPAVLLGGLLCIHRKFEVDLFSSTMQCEDVGMSILALLDLASHASSLDKVQIYLPISFYDLILHSCMRMNHLSAPYYSLLHRVYPLPRLPIQNRKLGVLEYPSNVFLITLQLHVPSLYENHDMLFVPFPMQHDVESLFSGVPTLDCECLVFLVVLSYDIFSQGVTSRCFCSL